MFRFAASLLLASFLFAPVAEARDREIRYDFDRKTIRAYNIALTSFFSLVSAVVQGEVTSWPDALRHFAIGAGAGVSYYQAKRLTGEGRVTAGWLLTNATASVVENTASGERALGRIGYTVGPLRFRVATPLARKAIARVEADWSLYETYSLWEARRDGDHVRFRNGMIAVDRDTPWPNPDVEGQFYRGRTTGVFPGVSPNSANRFLWSHEVIHAIQQQQLDAIEPPVYTFRKGEDESRPHRLFTFRHVRAGFIHALDAPTYNRRYWRRWGEIEAYALAERCPVPTGTFAPCR